MITAKAILLLLLNNNSLDIELADIDINQIYCLSLNVYYEAGAEHISGKNAVAHVTLNRKKDTRYPNKVCKVVKQAHMRDDIPFLPKRNKCAFSWYCDGLRDTGKFYREDGSLDQFEVAAYKQSAIISLMAYAGITGDPTYGATHYYNHNLVSPYWAEYYTTTIVIGEHTFCRREKGSLK